MSASRLTIVIIIAFLIGYIAGIKLFHTPYMIEYIDSPKLIEQCNESEGIFIAVKDNNEQTTGYCYTINKGVIFTRTIQ